MLVHSCSACFCGAMSVHTPSMAWSAPAPPLPFSLVDLHAAMTATAPASPAYAMCATAAAPSKGRASYVRRFCRVLRTSTMPLSGPLRRSWAIARLLEAIAVDHAWVGRLEVALDGDEGEAHVTVNHLATVAMAAADPSGHAVGVSPLLVVYTLINLK